MVPLWPLHFLCIVVVVVVLHSGSGGALAALPPPPPPSTAAQQQSTRGGGGGGGGTKTAATAASTPPNEDWSRQRAAVELFPAVVPEQQQQTAQIPHQSQQFELPDLYDRVHNWLALAMITSAVEDQTRAAAALYATSGQAADRALFAALCDRLPGLNAVQQRVCQEHPFLMPFVARGARQAVYECQSQFQDERWNCSDRYEIGRWRTAIQHDILGKAWRSSTREAGYLQAIASAGLVHAVTKGCASGNLSECGCDMRPNTLRYVDLEPEPAPGETAMLIGGGGGGGESFRRRGLRSTTHFTWGGCSDNVNYGVKFARDWSDEWERAQFEKTGDVAHLTRKHNAFVGREAVAQHMRRACRCHGVSGSCEFKTCWLQMPRMPELAEMLKKRYDHFAVQVTKRAKKRLRRKEREERRVPLRGNEIAYVQRSPHYCDRNDTMGILGTKGRECSPTSLKADSCDLLCCGRGYTTRDEERVTKCQCKFVWCCEVKCKTCRELVRVHECN